MQFKFKNFFRKTSLWKKIPRGKRKKIKALENKNTLSTQITESCKALVSYPEATSYPVENLLKLIYINFVYLEIIYFHHQTNKIDFCLQAIQKNPILTETFQLSYNEFRAKFDTLRLISKDQGENFTLALSRQTGFFSMLTHFFELLPVPFSALGGIIRIGINEINKRHKIYESKKLLNYCITDENFTKVVSLLFSYILIKNLSKIEDLDHSIQKNFSIFWEILKEQAEQFGNKPSFPENIEKIWAYCFCLFELAVYNHSNLNISEALLDSQPKNLINQTHPLCGTNFFDPKKFPSLPIQPFPTMNTISKFWENKTYHDKAIIESEMRPALPA